MYRRLGNSREPGSRAARSDREREKASTPGGEQAGGEGGVAPGTQAQVQRDARPLWGIMEGSVLPRAPAGFRQKDGV